MNGLPQGVTLSRTPEDLLEDPEQGILAEPSARAVKRDGKVLGWVWCRGEYTWHAETPSGNRRTFRYRSNAARWVCFQARPVVYQVRMARDGADLRGWDVFWPGERYPRAVYGRSGRLDALDLAHHCARSDALKAAP